MVAYNTVEILGIILVAAGVAGFLTVPTNILFIAISNELILLGLILLFIIQGAYILDLSSHVFVMVLLVVSAIEMGILISLWVSHTFSPLVFSETRINQ